MKRVHDDGFKIAIIIETFCTTVPQQIETSRLMLVCTYEVLRFRNL